MLASVKLLMGELFRRNAAVVPDAPAASLGDRVLTHGALDRAGNRLARALGAQGIGPGDRIATWCDTSLDVLPVFVAAAKLGAVFAPLNARFGPDEVADVVRLARPSVLVADADRSDAAETVARDAGVPRLAHVGGGHGPGLGLDPATSTESTDPLPPPQIDETAPHVIFFTSGSTGAPKGVILSHRAHHLRTFQGVFRDEPERSVCMFPLFHMAAFTLALAAWQTRGEIAFAPADADSLLETVARRRANRLYGIPAVWSRILAAPAGRFDTSSLREADTGTSAVPIELVRALKERFPGSVTRIYYGSTECGSATTLPDADVLRKPGSVGPPSPGSDLRLTDAGEICTRSPYLFSGYFDDVTATESVLRSGWYHTGDLGELDEEGYLSIVGRMKEIIRTGGESVVPAEVEAVLAEHPGVAEVAVVGIPDPDWGEVVCAAVVPAGDGPSLEDLQRLCEGRLAGFKKPRRLERVGDLPRTPATGQVQRTLLVERILSR